jgi:hypothetical protein
VKGGFKMGKTKRAEKTSQMIDSSLEKLEKINDTIKKKKGIQKVEELQANFADIVSPMLLLMLHDKSGRDACKVLLGSGVRVKNFFNVHKNPLKILSKKSPAAQFVSFPTDELHFENDHPTLETVPEVDELSEDLDEILQKFSVTFNTYYEKIKKKEDSSGASVTKQQLNKFCKLVCEIFSDCRAGILFHCTEAMKSAIDPPMFNGSVSATAKVTEVLVKVFSENNAENKEIYFKELVVICGNKKPSELIPEKVVWKLISPIFIFDNKISIINWAVFCWRYLVENLGVEDIPTFLKACQTDDRYLPKDWAFAHKIDFLKLNGKPIYGAGYWKAKVSAIIPLILQKFGEISSATINLKKSLPGFAANKNHTLGQTKIKVFLRLARTSNDVLKDFDNMCNIANFNTTSEVKYLTDLAEDKQEDAVQEPSTEEKSTEKAKSKKSNKT